MIKPDNTEIRKKFGENMRSLRKSRGYSQQKFADILGVTQAAISSWESGIREPEFSIIFDISKQFRVPVSSLIPLEESGLEEDAYRSLSDLSHQNPKWISALSKARYLPEHEAELVISMIETLSKGNSTDE